MIPECEICGGLMRRIKLGHNRYGDRYATFKCCGQSITIYEDDDYEGEDDVHESDSDSVQ